MKHAFRPDREGLTALAKDGGRVRVCDVCGGVEGAAIHSLPAADFGPTEARVAARLLGCRHEGDQWWPRFRERRTRSAPQIQSTGDFIRAEVIEMRLCEVPHLFLKSGQLYRFGVDENCEKCRTLAKHATTYTVHIEARGE